MKFQLIGNELNDILRMVIKGFNPKEDNSYIAFKLNPEKSELIITSRSRATFFQGSLKVHSVEIDENEPLVYHLDGVKLKQISDVLPKSPVNIEFSISDETRSFTVKTVGSKYKLPVLSETPIAELPETTEYSTVDANDFMKALKDLVRIISTEPSTQEHQVSCMHLKLDEDSLKMSATDAYALGSIKIANSPIELEEEKDVLIRHTEMTTLAETFNNGENLTIIGSNNMFGYVDENGTVSLVGIINMQPLDTTGLEGATQSENTVTVDKNELKAAIEKMSKLSPEDSSIDIELIDEDNIKISNRYEDYTMVKPTSATLVTPGAASFATNVILKAITPANSGDLRLEFGNLQDGSIGAARIVSLMADGTDDESTSLLAIRMAR